MQEVIVDHYRDLINTNEGKIRAEARKAALRERPRVFFVAKIYLYLQPVAVVLTSQTPIRSGACTTADWFHWVHLPLS